MSETTTVRVSSAPESTTVRVAGDADTTVVAVGPELTTVVASGEIGPRGPSGLQELTVVAHVNLSGHRAVKPRPDGTVDYADRTTSGDAELPIWLTEGAALAGAPVTVLTYGEITEPSWSWTPGLGVFLDTNGQLTQTPPTSGFLLQVATAPAPTVLFWDPKVPIRLT